MFPSTCFSRMNWSLSKYNVKGVLTARQVFLRLFIPTFTKESNYNSPFLGKKSTPLWGIFNNYKEKLSVPRVQTAALSLKVNLQ